MEKEKFILSLKKVTDFFDMVPTEGAAYLDTETGEYIYLSDEVVQAAERDEKYNNWMDDAIELTRLIDKEPERFRPLPTPYDIDGWDIMRRFVEQIEDERIASDLDRAIHGKGAFRRFKDELYRHDLWEQWNPFKLHALAEIAADWLDEENLPYKDDVTESDP